MRTDTKTANSSLSYARRFLRLPQVEELIGFKRSHIYNLIKSGQFPRPIKLGARAVAWDSFAISEWQESKLNG